MIQDFLRVRWKSLLETTGTYGPAALVKVKGEHGEVLYCFLRPGRPPGEESILIEKRTFQLFIAAAEKDIELDDATSARMRGIR